MSGVLLAHHLEHSGTLNMPARSRTAARRARNASLILGLYAVLGGVVSFAGWAADLPRLTDWNGGGISIQPNATIAAFTSGVAILLLEFGYRRIAAVCGVLVAAIGASVIYQYLSGTDLHIDTLLLFGREWGRGGVLSSAEWVLQVRFRGPSSALRALSPLSSPLAGCGSGRSSRSSPR
jgi:hypothetical protein